MEYQIVGLALITVILIIVWRFILSQVYPQGYYYKPLPRKTKSNDLKNLSKDWAKILERKDL